MVGRGCRLGTSFLSIVAMNSFAVPLMNWPSVTRRSCYIQVARFSTKNTTNDNASILQAIWHDRILLDKACVNSQMLFAT